MRKLNFIDAVEKALELHVVSALAYWNNMVIAITILHNYNIIMIMKIRVQLHCTGLNV